MQRYKGLGEMSSQQFWETTIDSERRTLLSVKLEDLTETETIFTTLMGEDVESRRKFIEENALEVKNLDISMVYSGLGEKCRRLKTARFREGCGTWRRSAAVPVPRLLSAGRAQLSVTLNSPISPAIT